MARYPDPPGLQSPSNRPSNNQPQNYTDTINSITNTSENSGGTTSTSGSKNWSQTTTGASSTKDVTDRTVVNKNMDDEAYKMLMDFLRQQAAGGTTEDRARREAIWGEIAAGQAQRAGYSKAAAVVDSTAAASAQMTNALKQMLPAITAGVDSAGTSGSAMAALLSQQAAESVSRNAAQLQLDAAISYGQIANQSSGIIAELLKIDDQSSNRFLEGLNIAKGAITSTTDRTVRNVNTSSSENIRGSENSSSMSTTSNYSNSSSNQSGTTSRSYSPTSGNTGGYTEHVGGGGGYTSPSSYRNGNY